MKPAPWRVTESKYLIDDPWLRLRSDECVTASGVRISRYYVFEYPPWVTVFPVTSSGDLVLVRQYRHALGEVLLELPGGRCEPSDVDPVAVAKRELEEETGYVGGTFEEIAKVAPDPARQTNFSHVVVATGVRVANMPYPEATEALEVVLMPLGEVTTQMRRGTFLPALHLSAVYFGLSHLGLIH